MKYVVPLFVLVCPLLVGCASDGALRDETADRPAKRRSRIASQSNFERSAGAREMGVQNEMGVYESADIEETLAEHMEEVRGCYGRAGRAQRYAAGKVTLRFIVSGEGKPQDVLVIASDLGNYDVERCLVDMGRRVKFPPPSGRKGTSFEYPVEFRSTNEMQVQDVEDSLKVTEDVTALMHSLASCGAVTDSGASAIFYVEPNGTVASVGLAAESTLDETAGACLVREMRRWKMSTVLPGRMLRCRTNIPAVIAAAEPPPSRPSALSAAGRKRRR